MNVLIVQNIFTYFDSKFSRLAQLQNFSVHVQIVAWIAIVHDGLGLLLLQGFGKVEVLYSDMSENF